MEKDRKAFTIIEFLALAALLALGVYARLDAIRERQIGRRCLKNLVKIGEASQQYREDYDGYFVPGFLPDTGGKYGPTWCGLGNTGWHFYYLLDPYLKGKKVWDHTPFSRSETFTKCSGWVTPPNEYAVNQVVHVRNSGAGRPSIPSTAFEAWASGYWKSKETKDVEYYGPKEERRVQMGTFGPWAPTLCESEVHFPDRLISMCENTRSVTLDPGCFIWRNNTFHRVLSQGWGGSPSPSPAHGNTYGTLFCDGHAELLTEEDIRFAMMWNNSPYEDGGLCNRNRSRSESDDVYHPAWIPVSCQLNPDEKSVLRNFHFYPSQRETIFDIDGTYGEYNTLERPDPKYDE